MSLRWEAASPEVAAALRELSGTLSESDFYLAGGTALALQEGHRLSDDLDLFSPTFSDPESLIRELARLPSTLEVTLTAPQTLYVRVGAAQVSFFGYGYPLVAPLVEAGSGLIPLADRDDIAAMKLAAIAARGSRKDFVDLCWLVQHHRSLADYLELYRHKYAERDPGHVVRSLVFFDDAEEEPPLRMLVDLDWDDVKESFRRWVGELLESANP